MKITFIGHASLLIETRGLTLLSDPWWGHPCFGAQWWNYPRAMGSLAEGRKLDYIYISHGHADHLHPGTLSRLERGAKVLVAAGCGLAPDIEGAGFEVRELTADREHSLEGGVTCRIMPTCGGDSLMSVADGREVCVNLNDALHSAPADVQAHFVARLRKLYPSIDYVFCGYGVASHFPNCYRIPGKDRAATAAARQRYFNEQWAGLIAGLAPRMGFPFAADVVFLQDDLFWVNEPTHNSERPTATLARLYPQFDGRTFDIAPGFVVRDGQVATAHLRAPVRNESLRAEMAAEISKANRYGKADPSTVEAIHRLLVDNLETCRPYLASYPGDYRMQVRFPDSAHGILIEKRGATLDAQVADSTDVTACDLTFTTRAQYLRTSLTRTYGNETLFVGSGGMFDYPTRAQALRNLQNELRVMISKHAEVPAPRPKPPNKLIALAKRLAKRALGRTEPGLYDLGIWTVWLPDSLTPGSPG